MKGIRNRVNLQRSPGNMLKDGIHADVCFLTQNNNLRSGNVCLHHSHPAQNMLRTSLVLQSLSSVRGSKSSPPHYANVNCHIEDYNNPKKAKLQYCLNVEKHSMNNIKKPQKDDFIDDVSSKEVKIFSTREKSDTPPV